MDVASGFRLTLPAAFELRPGCSMRSYPDRAGSTSCLDVETLRGSSVPGGGEQHEGTSSRAGFSAARHYRLAELHHSYASGIRLAANPEW